MKLTCVYLKPLMKEQQLSVSGVQYLVVKRSTGDRRLYTSHHEACY